MKRSVFNLVRLAALLGVGACSVAVGLGGMVGPERGGGVPVPVSYAGLGGALPEEPSGRASLLDLRTGRVVRLALARDERIDMMSESPWRGPGGVAEIAGRWFRRGEDGTLDALGLALVAVPEGRMLRCAASEVVPSSAPCWIPGPPPRIVFSAGDRALYSFAFGEDAESIPSPPGPIGWRRLPDGLSDVRIEEPALLPGPSARQGVRLVVALAGRPAGRPGPFCKPSLWWLELDCNGTEVVAAGPLFDRDAPPGAEERLPAAGRSAAGAPVLVFLTRGPADAGWRLEAVPLESKPGGTPLVRRSRIRVLAEGCAPVAPSLCPDGGTVAYIPGPHRLPGQPAPRRVPLAMPGAPVGPG